MAVALRPQWIASFLAMTGWGAMTGAAVAFAVQLTELVAHCTFLTLRC
jgi:hypothetical protein